MERFSQPVLRVESDSGHMSSDEELSDWREENLEFTREMILSRKKVDRRMVDIYKLKKVHETMGAAKNFKSTLEAIIPSLEVPLASELLEHS